MYTAMITRDDGVKSTGHFALGDIYRGKDFATALNKSTEAGGLICLLQSHDLARLVKNQIKDLKTRLPVYRRELVTYGGIQEGSNVMVLNAEDVVHLDTGTLGTVEDTSFVCIGKRQLHMERTVNKPVSVEPLGKFLDSGLHVLGHKTFGVAVMAWCAMYTLNIYGWIVGNLRHFNLPVLFGEPMVGKSLIASCAAWLNGCPKTAIVSRSTLSYVTSVVTGSTMPFVWDDPSTPNEVSQLAIDLGNAAVRGKISQDTQPPKTGCLVTANFDMSEMLKYFSRIVVLLVEGTTKRKVAGEAMLLEQDARKASASFPLVMKTLNSLQLQDVHQEYRLLRQHLSTDIRILEGIAVNLHVTRQILNLAGRYQYLKYVNDYIRDTMIPYYRQQLHDAPVNQQPTFQDNDLTAALNLEMLNPQTCVLVKGGSVLAVEPCVMRRDISGAKGVIFNKATRIRGKTKKMIHINTQEFEKDSLKIIFDHVSDRTRKQPVPPSVEPTSCLASTVPAATPQRSSSTAPATITPERPLTPERSSSTAPATITPERPLTPERSSSTAPATITPERPLTPERSSSTAPATITPERPLTPERSSSTAPATITPERPLTPERSSSTAPATITTERPLTPERPASSARTPERPPSPTSVATPVRSSTAAGPKSFMQQLVKIPVKAKEPRTSQASQPTNKQLKRLLLPLQVNCETPEDPIPCSKCNKKGHGGRLWVQCENCNKWYHSSCKGISAKRHKSSEFQNKPWTCC